MLVTDIGVEMCYRPLSHLNSNQHKDYSQRCCKTVTLISMKPFLGQLVEKLVLKVLIVKHSL